MLVKTNSLNIESKQWMKLAPSQVLQQYILYYIYMLVETADRVSKSANRIGISKTTGVR